MKEGIQLHNIPEHLTPVLVKSNKVTKKVAGSVSLATLLPCAPVTLLPCYPAPLPPDVLPPRPELPAGKCQIR